MWDTCNAGNEIEVKYVVVDLFTTRRKEERIYDSVFGPASLERMNVSSFKLDKAAFTLAYPSAPEKGLLDGAPLKAKLEQNGARYSSGEELFRSTSRLGPKASWITNLRQPNSFLIQQGYDAAEESPSLADLSSNNLTPETVRHAGGDKQKRSAAARKQHKKRRQQQQPPEPIDQSVFPVRTPDKEGFLGPLSDLLEEEITLPGEESRYVRTIFCFQSEHDACRCSLASPPLIHFAERTRLRRLATARTGPTFRGHRPPRPSPRRRLPRRPRPKWRPRGEEAMRGARLRRRKRMTTVHVHVSPRNRLACGFCTLTYVHES